jgi:hypothetical protein
MVNTDTDDQIWALRAEAHESRGLAQSLNDAQSAADLLAYALVLEAEAAKLQSENFPPNTQAAWESGKRDRRSSQRSHIISAS